MPGKKWWKQSKKREKSSFQHEDGSHFPQNKTKKQNVKGNGIQKLEKV